MKRKTQGLTEVGLRWPVNYPRTRPQDQDTRAAWKLTFRKYYDALATEFERMGAPSFVVTLSDVTSRDVGVAVYFSRKAADDFGWQDALGISDPYPTLDQVNSAFRTKAAPHHPDRGGDADIFRALARHRDNAVRFVQQQEGKNLDFVIACDSFKEQRWNLAAIMLTIRALRQIERCGTSTMMEQAFKGFAALPEARS